MATEKNIRLAFSLLKFMNCL